MHNIEYITVPENVKRKELLSDIVQIAERNGDGYCGPMHWHDEIKPLESYDEAQRRIQSLDKGWYDDHAVRYYDYTNASTTDKMVEIRRRIAKLCKQRDEFVEKTSVRKFKANYIGCKCCESKLRRDKLRGEHCPVCGKDLRADSTIEKIKDYEKRISQCWADIESEKKKQTKARKVMWLVKYEYHS